MPQDICGKGGADVEFDETNSFTFLRLGCVSFFVEVDFD